MLDRRWTLALRTALAVYLAAVLCLTMWPSLEQTAVPSWAEAVVRAAATVGLTLTVAFLEAASNLVMFVPFGVLVLLLWWGARRRSARAGGAGAGAWRLVLPVTGVACAFSAAIELAQLGIPARVSTVQDLVLNTAGGLLGAAVTAAVVTAVGRRPAAPSAADRVQD
ncbi:VanZ family protein [Puerhibacterium sp. TATVAM-FAB25]|uniref:VanZ family protein n=1 Tax=Puerhibacterium sp. TATVAM-FAB25 TaxID=3093699 RepID=UPI00397CCCD6